MSPDWRESYVGVAALSVGKGLDPAFGVVILYVEVRWIAEDSRAVSKEVAAGGARLVSR